MTRSGARKAAMILGASLLASAAAGRVAAQGRGTGAGLYTIAQADAGERLYAIHCAMCHGSGLQGTVEVPPLTGRFVANWGGRPLGELFDYLSRAMPQHAPGALSAADNAKILAYLLRVNGAPAGEGELPSQASQLERIRFDAIQPAP
ncbi:c-type cytochrome [Alteraurantiacibacter palmitatis]|uniref:C-type cytochrome n=1 Tax=Alteraurantiacibacter palmitatis TaxID=2054628 RepID=A0ABV7E7P8_9SPHN